MNAPIWIPRDPERRRQLAEMAGLTDEERLALDKWCDLQATEDDASRRRGWEREGSRSIGKSQMTFDEPLDLLPAESMALTVALAQTLRGDTVPPNTAALCVLALARITGRHDYTEGHDD